MLHKWWEEEEEDIYFNKYQAFYLELLSDFYAVKQLFYCLRTSAWWRDGSQRGGRGGGWDLRVREEGRGEEVGDGFMLWFVSAVS